ncbi:hypothetical protein Hte_010629 [Hypoxylon texense]
MAGSEVGFSFQADVVSVGSLAHLITGRALKALSDGGVDFYAVAAVHVLGKNLVVKSSLEMTVHSHVVAMGRTGIQSVLAKALKIGWGHSALAEDMTRTRAGTNALLLIGALASGSTNFLAAECLSQLLSLHGFEADKLPNLDVLKRMIEYLAPFVKDLGFSKILGHTTATAKGVFNPMGVDNNQEERHLTDHGDAIGVAGAINQLMLTSRKRETIYMPTRMRGAWLSTFASHLLGMAVELRLNDVVVWESAGSNGTAIFELGQHRAKDSRVQTVSHRRIILVQPSAPVKQTSVVVSYPIRDAFESVMIQFPMVSAELKIAIRLAICRLSRGIVKHLRFSTKTIPSHRINGNFDAHKALQETLEAFGFERTLIDSRGTYDGVTQYSRKLTVHGLIALDNAQDIVTTCGAHIGSSFPMSYKQIERIFESSCTSRCLCSRVGNIITGFATAATALMQCQFDAAELMLRSDFLLGDNGASFQDYPSLTSALMMAYIMSLTCDDSGAKFEEKELRALNWRNEVLGLSSGSHTLYYTCLMSNDCYDPQGRFLSLSSGRASTDGMLRSLLLETQSGGFPNVARIFSDTSTSLNSGFILQPHFIPSSTNIYMQVSLDEEAIRICFTVEAENSLTQDICITNYIKNMLQHSNRHCNHGTDSKFQVELGYTLAVVGFTPFLPNEEPGEDTVRVFALHGNKLQQIVTVGRLKQMSASFGNESPCELQLLACLKCCIKAAAKKRYHYSRNVVMGG